MLRTGTTAAAKQRFSDCARGLARGRGARAERSGMLSIAGLKLLYPVLESHSGSTRGGFVDHEVQVHISQPYSASLTSSDAALCWLDTAKRNRSAASCLLSLLFGL